MIHFKNLKSVLAQLIGGVMEQTDFSRQTHLTRDVALLFGRETSVAARKDFATLVDEATQLGRAFVVEAGDKFRVKRLALGARWAKRTAWS